MEKLDYGTLDEEDSRSDEYINAVHEASAKSIERFHEVSKTCIQNIINKNESYED